jgi:putative DNA primase/helicase
MFILFGSGANGKSTFLNTIAHILGEYSMTAQTETFMKQQGDKMSNDLARLRYNDGRYWQGIMLRAELT